MANNTRDQDEEPFHSPSVKPWKGINLVTFDNTGYQRIIEFRTPFKAPEQLCNFQNLKWNTAHSPYFAIELK